METVKIPLELLTRIKVLLQKHASSEDAYPSSPIGNGNPYYRCNGCGRSAPEISYAGHYAECEYGGKSDAWLLIEEIEKIS